MADNKTPIRDINGHLVVDQAARDQAAQNAERIDELSEEIANAVPATDQPNMQLVTDANGEKKWEERLAYEGRVVSQVYMEHTTLTPVADDMTMPGYEGRTAYGPALGRNELVGSTVVWNGTEYLLDRDPVWVSGSGSGKAYAVGNVSIVGYNGDGEALPDTGEPFCIVCGAAVAEIWIITNTDTIEGFTMEIVRYEDGVKTIDPKFLPASSGVVVGVVTSSSYNNLLLDIEAGASYGDLRRAVKQNETAGLRFCIDDDLIGTMWFTGSIIEMDGVQVAMFAGMLYRQSEDAYIVERVAMPMDNPDPDAGEMPDDFGYLMAMTNFSAYIPVGSKHIVLKDDNDVRWKVTVDTDGSLKTERV